MKNNSKDHMRIASLFRQMTLKNPDFSNVLLLKKAITTTTTIIISKIIIAKRPHHKLHVTVIIT